TDCVPDPVAQLGSQCEAGSGQDSRLDSAGDTEHGGDRSYGEPGSIGPRDKESGQTSASQRSPGYGRVGTDTEARSESLSGLRAGPEARDGCDSRRNEPVANQHEGSLGSDSNRPED